MANGIITDSYTDSIKVIFDEYCSHFAFYDDNSKTIHLQSTDITEDRICRVVVDLIDINDSIKSYAFNISFKTNQEV